MKNILFVCKHNIFRSKVAEAYFNKINKNNKIKISSAGAIKGSSLIKRQIGTSKKFGITLKRKPQGLSINLIKKQNLIIIVADDVPKSLFNNKSYVNPKTTKVIQWKIKDDLKPQQGAKTEKIIKSIMKKVEKLNKKLSK